MKMEIGLKGYFTSNAGASQLRQRAEVIRVWSDSCVNVQCDDGTINTSVLVKQDNDCAGYYFEPDQVDAVEAEIRAKGLTAPRVTPADIEANIVAERYFTAADGCVGAALNSPNIDSPEAVADAASRASDQLVALGLLTFCVLILRNGFSVTGESACASPENFDAELGRKIARQAAISKLWPLMGYELRSKLAAG